MMGTSCGGGGRGVVPFYRVREAGRWPVIEGEAKRRWRRLREGKRGGRVTSGPVRRRWPEAHGGARRGRPSDDGRASEAGGRT
jgi:hypothetical protein